MHGRLFPASHGVGSVRRAWLTRGEAAAGVAVAVTVVSLRSGGWRARGLGGDGSVR